MLALRYKTDRAWVRNLLQPVGGHLSLDLSSLNHSTLRRRVTGSPCILWALRAAEHFSGRQGAAKGMTAPRRHDFWLCGLVDGVSTFFWSKSEPNFHRRMAGRCTRRCTYRTAGAVRADALTLYDWLCGVSTLSAAHCFSPLRRAWCHGHFSLSQATLVRWSISIKHPFPCTSHSKLFQVIRRWVARAGPVVRICSNDLRTASEDSRLLEACLRHIASSG